MSISVGKKPVVVKARSGAIDFLRILGIIAVVAGHTWENDFTERALYSWHVPIFFFLSGYLWTTGRSLRLELSNRIAALGRPYVFWLGVLLVVSVTFAAWTGELGVGDVVYPLYGGYFATRPFTAFWFVTVLLSAAVLYRLIEKLPSWLRWSIIGTGVLVGSLAGDLLAKTPLSIGSAWPCVAFMAAGAEWRRAESKLTRPALVGVGLLVAGAAMVAMGLSAPINIKYGDYGTPVLSMFVACALSAGALAVAKSLFYLLPRAFSEVSIWLAKAGFIVVLTHAVPLLLLGTTQAGGALDFAIALLVPWTLGLLLVSSRLAPWAAGMDRQPKGFR